MEKEGLRRGRQERRGMERRRTLGILRCWWRWSWMERKKLKRGRKRENEEGREDLRCKEMRLGWAKRGEGTVPGGLGERGRRKKEEGRSGRREVRDDRRKGMWEGEKVDKLDVKGSWTRRG